MGRQNFPILILGSGIAGATAAIKLSDLGFKVLLVSKDTDPSESNTKYAQGGIVGKGEDDSPKLLAEDIRKAGSKAGRKEAIKLLVEEGPEFMEEFLIKRLKVPFDKTRTGKFQLTKEGGHSARRVYFSKDATGKAIEKALLSEVKKSPNIEVLTNHTAIDLITPSHHSPLFEASHEPPRVIGAYLLDNTTRRVKKILSPKTVLATGGMGSLYLYTTNPDGARGDGVAMAYRAGAKIINAQYVQFHPTALYHRGARRFLISEAVRGEGAVLRNKKGETFVDSLAPRDKVARAIYEEMLNSKTDCVFLDAAPIAKKGANLAKRFPTIFSECQKSGIDMRKDWIPVVPAAHYFCGGIAADLRGGTSLANLYAVGEVSCTGVHGANRLASTSLLEGLLWGKRVAEDIAKIFQPAARGKPRQRREAAGDLVKWRIPEWKDSGLTDEVDPALIAQDFLAIKTTMWNYIGIVRTEKRLERAVSDLSYLQKQIEDFYRSTKLTDELVGLRHGILIALLIAQAALKNEKSSGCHFRTS